MAIPAAPGCACQAATLGMWWPPETFAAAKYAIAPAPAYIAAESVQLKGGLRSVALPAAGFSVELPLGLQGFPDASGPGA